jgi:hypothetical protein
LENIGIDEEEKKRRNLTPHAWRHFLNTALRSKGVADSKIRAITGHASQAMTDHYTDFNSSDLNEVQVVQNALLTGEGNALQGWDCATSVVESGAGAGSSVGLGLAVGVDLAAAGLDLGTLKALVAVLEAREKA